MAFGLVVRSDIRNCHSLDLDNLAEIGNHSPGAAGRCRIEKGLGSCMGRYCTADFGRRSSRVIHRNTHWMQFGEFVTKSMNGMV